MDVLKGKSDQAKEKNGNRKSLTLREVPRTQCRDQEGAMAPGTDGCGALQVPRALFPSCWWPTRPAGKGV